MVQMKPALISGKWEILLPDFRADRGWDEENDCDAWLTWERDRLASMRSELGPGDIILDIGAEEGDMPALYASWGCKVMLAEPNERVWPHIYAIWEANDLEDPLVKFHGFIDDVEGPLPGETYKEWPAAIHGDLVKAHGFYHTYEQPDYQRISVDRLCEDTDVIPDAITIDVEGAELRVLRSARATLMNHKPLVWVSVHPTMISVYGHADSDVHEFMCSPEVDYVGRHLATDHEEHWLFTPR
jgi:FkbM family methyltransferase